jgi:hypothetical protein
MRYKTVIKRNLNSQRNNAKVSKYKRQKKVHVGDKIEGTTQQTQTTSLTVGIIIVQMKLTS